MIVVRLKGGLGNQLFQYAAGRALAHRHRVSLWFDTSFYLDPRVRSGAHPRAYLLDELCCTGHILEAPTAALLGVGSRRQITRNAVRTLLGDFVPRVYREPQFHYDPGFDVLPSNVVLEGYWQSERYFRHVGGRIREEFRPRSVGLLARCLRFLAEVRKTAAVVVSLHVRRGDFLEFQKRGVQLVLPAKYYENGMKRFSADTAFVLCSDDRPWCEEHLSGRRVFMSPGADAIEDLVLMSLCDHHIISNSTFSWWAAWLGNNPIKRVIRPTAWFGPRHAGRDLRDLFLCDWEDVGW